MRPRYWFLKFYLIVALILGVLSLSDSIFSALDININVYNLTLLIIGFFFFFFNIIAIPLFHHHHVKKIAYVLPIYHIITYLLFLGLGFYLAALQNVDSLIWNSLTITGFITSIFEIVFSLYLLRKFFSVSEIHEEENYHPSSLSK